MTSTSSPIMTFSITGPSSTISCGMMRCFSQVGFAIGVAQLPLGQFVGKAERHVAARAGEHVHQQPAALGAARDVLEHHARAVLGAQHRFGGKPDVLLAVGALDGADLAQPLGHGEPFAQVVIGDVAGEIALVAHRAVDLSSRLLMMRLGIFAHRAGRAQFEAAAGLMPGGRSIAL